MSRIRGRAEFSIMATNSSGLQESQQPKMMGIFTTFLILPLIAVGLRILSRRLTRMELWWDDWLILIATVGIQLIQCV